MFKIEQLNASYGGGLVVRDLTLEIAEGEVLCLMGRNGAGKSSTLRAIMGLIPLRTGGLKLGGCDISHLSAHQIPAVGIGYVPQGRRLFAELTVKQNLDIGLMACGSGSGSGSGSGETMLEQALSLFPVLRDRLQQISGTLSGGEQQMLAMARALCLKPSLLLLDEPTEGLMPTMISTIRRVICSLAENGVSILLVEQRVDALLSVASRVAFMDNGVLQDTVDISQIEHNPALIKKYAGVG